MHTNRKATPSLWIGISLKGISVALVEKAKEFCREQVRVKFIRKQVKARQSAIRFIHVQVLY